MKATALAPANIALIKYWGKRNQQLILPQNNNISMCLSGLQTRTTVDFDEQLEEDQVSYDDQPLEGKKKQRVITHLDLVRDMAGISSKAKIASSANFPMGAGLASSASGFAALSMAAAAAAGLQLSEKELSILARRGSGSASRSIPDGFVEWDKGSEEDGSDSFARSIQSPDDDWGFRMLITITTTQEKPISSRAGMAQSVETSPYYPGWLSTIEADLEQVRSGILAHDFEQVAQAAEYNALKMHSVMITTRPSIIYWTPSTMRIIHHVRKLRADGLLIYFTMDGGPQVKVMCRQQDEEAVMEELKKIEEIKEIIPCKPSIGASLSEEHLF